MNLDLLTRLCAVPTRSYQEDQMVSFLCGHLAERVRTGRVWVDEHRNVFVVKGSGQHLPCVAAHIDSVQPLRKVSIVQQDGMLTGEYKGKQVGFGADDKAGVYICLELLDRFDNIAAAFFATEELGCRGSYGADLQVFDHMGYLLEFDCPSRGLFSYTSSGTRLFENQGEFIHTALPVLLKHGTTEWQNHPYTDVMAVRKRTTLSCMNLSCGYYNWHAKDEYVRLADTEASLAMAIELIKALGARRYDYDAVKEDAASPPLLEVKSLGVVDAALLG